MIRTRRLRLAAAGLIAGLVTTMAGVSLAHAEVNPALIDTTQSTSLVIHKYLGAKQAGLPNDGRKLDDSTFSGTQKLAGVTFDVYKVTPADLTTNAGWETAAALSDYKITAAAIAAKSFVHKGVTYTLTGPTPVTTNGTGEATYPGGIGLYLVNENLGVSTPNVGGTAVTGTITPASPFFVTLPMTNPENKSEWMYEVNVYPKNSADSITKEVIDNGTLVVGQDLDYKILTTVSPVSDANGDGTVNGEDVGYYYVGDELSEFVQFKSVAVSLVTDPATSTVALTGCDASATTVAGCDYFYFVEKDAAGDPVVGKGVKVVFTTQGLDKLAANKLDKGAALRVQTDITTTVKSIPDSGLVPNEAQFIPSKAWWDSNYPGTNPPEPPDPNNPPTDNPPPGTPGIPSNPVVSKFGDIVIHKTDPASEGSYLVGAEFAVYKKSPKGECTAADITGDPVTTATITDKPGLYKFAGLRVSNFADNETLADGDSRYLTYCIVETKAPQGYQLLATPVTVNLLQAGQIPVTANTTWETIEKAKGVAIQINNTPDNLGQDLPLTGGAGIGLISLAGLLLIGGGVTYYVVSSRRRSAKQS